MKRAKTAPQGPVEDVRIQEFLDMIAPSIVKFNTDHFICGNTFRIGSRISQHISFLKDFFRSYKDFADRESDVIEIMLQKLYALIEDEYRHFDADSRQLHTAEMLQSILLALQRKSKILDLFRHSYGAILYRNNMSKAEIAKLLGHEQETTTEIYVEN